MKKADREYKAKRKEEMIAALEKADNPRQLVRDKYKAAVKGIILAAVTEFIVLLNEEKSLKRSRVEQFVSDFVEKNCIPCD